RLAAEGRPVVIAPSRSSRSDVPKDPWDAPPTLSRQSGLETNARRRKLRRSAEREGGSSPDGATSEGGTEVAGGDGGQLPGQRLPVTAPMPATVLRINVKSGDAAKKGDVLVLLEAMKMELPVRATDAGVVAAVRCREGQLVDADAVLVEWQ